ncbi:MAG TPA: NAD(P)-dependent oxidoreductase [Solirubrobacterales bacterium]|nr:NAD(P)-dependent oxidoreductase [Solirubrobacterales bacterium]
MAASSEPEQPSASLPPAPTIGWIGLGEMGLPMAANLAAAGHRVVGLDRDPSRVEAASRAGVEVADSLPALLAADPAVLVTMLRTGAQTAELLTGPEGVAATANRPLDVVMMSTMDPPSVERLAGECAGHDLTLLDVPVSGGVRGAEAGTLSIMASGDPAALDRVRPLLEPLGARVHELGARPGASQAAKLANQVMMATAIAGTYEALALAGDYGLEPEPVIGAVLDGTGASWPLAHWDWMRSLWEEYEPESALDILDKDLKAVIAAVRERGADLPVTEATFARLTELWDEARAAATARRAAG